MTKSGHLDIVLSNDSPDPKLILLNDSKGNFRIVTALMATRNGPTRNAAVGDLNGDGYPDIVVANRMSTSHYCLNDGKLHSRVPEAGAFVECGDRADRRCGWRRRRTTSSIPAEIPARA